MGTAVVAGLALAVALLAVLVVGLLRSHADILKALHDLGVNLEDGPSSPAHAGRRPAVSAHAPTRTAHGVPTPRGGDAPLGRAADITGTLPHGGSARVAVLDVPHSTLLAFLSTGCGTCGVFWEQLQGLDEGDLPGVDTRVVIVTQGPEQESPAAVADLAPRGLATVMSDEAWDAYGIPISPYFVLADGSSGRVVGEGAGTSWAQVRGLLSRAADDAGLASRPAAPRLTRMGGQDRADWVDAQLLAAGLEPGDPSLHPPAHPSRATADTEVS